MSRRAGDPAAVVTVAVADDHPVYRRGLELMLREADGIELVGTAEDGRQAVTLVAERRPDVVLMDLAMPGLDGFSATRQIAALPSPPPVVALTMADDDRSLARAIQAGAVGYIVKGADLDEIIDAIHGAARGEAVFGLSLTQRVLQHVSRGATAAPTSFPTLTEREQEVLNHVAAGEANATIARELGISLKTVRNHLSNIFTKIQVPDRAAAIVAARDAGFGR